MKKLLASLMLLLFSVGAMAQVWYYVPAGVDPETGEDLAVIIIKDTGGTLWIYDKSLGAVRNCFLKDNDFYVNAFNYSKIRKRGIGQTPDYNTRVVTHKGIDIYFYKLECKSKNAKCYVYKHTSPNPFVRNYTHSDIAISLDFNTLVLFAETATPHYYTSTPEEKFIVRKSVDDLF